MKCVSRSTFREAYLPIVLIHAEMRDRFIYHWRCLRSLTFDRDNKTCDTSSPTSFEFEIHSSHCPALRQMILILPFRQIRRKTKVNDDPMPRVSREHFEPFVNRSRVLSETPPNSRCACSTARDQLIDSCVPDEANGNFIEEITEFISLPC
jgi:hypothetical protein